MNHLHARLEAELTTTTVEHFFQEAYYWRFQKKNDCYLDVLKYKMHYIVPSFVESYLKHLEVEEQSCDDIYPVIVQRGD